MPKTNSGKDQRFDQMLQDSKELVRAFAKQNIDEILLVDADATVVEWDHIMEEITGLSSDEAFGMKAWDLQTLLIPEEQRVPEAYARYKKAFLEMVGLALIKRIIEYHGGRIWVESAAPSQGEAGQESTFYFTLEKEA